MDSTAVPANLGAASPVPPGVAGAESLRPVVRLIDDTVVGYQGPCAAATLAWAAQAAAPILFLEAAADLLAPGAAGRLARLLHDAGVTAKDVVVELAEAHLRADRDIERIVADLRSQGMRVATRVSGRGHSDMLRTAELRPDFVKVGAALTSDVAANGSRRAMLVSLLSFATHINAPLIAEGIAGDADLRALTELGIQFGQGDHLGARRGGGFSAEELGRTGTDHDADGASREPGLARVSLPHALSSAALALQAEHDPQRILAVIAEQLSLVVPVDDLSIYAADHAAHRFVAVFATGPQAAIIMDDSFSMSVGLNGWAFALGTPQNLANAGAHPAATTIPNTPFEHESLLLIPLVAGDHKLGMLNCRRMGLNRFGDDDLEAASLFGHTAAAAWHNAQLYEELARRAMTDGLTDLFNSRWLREAGERELADCRRRDVPLSVVLVDLDHFKQINDTGGHSAGDVVLQRVADELRNITRAGDAAVRLGGEEFVLLLRDSDAAGAVRVADDLRAALSNVPIPAECEGIQRISASIGIASFPADASTLADLVRTADVAMYAAKREGRDRVRLAATNLPASAGTGTAVA